MISPYVLLFLAAHTGVNVWRAVNLLPDPPFNPKFKITPHEACLAGTYMVLALVLFASYDILDHA